MSFDSTQKELHSYLKAHILWRNFLPIAELLIILMHFGLIIGDFIEMGIFATFISILATISIVMVLAKGNYKVLTIGLIIRVIEYLVSFTVSLIAYQHFSFSSIIYGVVWAMFALQAYKKSNMTVKDLKSAASISGIKNSMNMEEAKQFNFNNLKKDVVDGSKAAMDSVNEIKKDFDNGKENGQQNNNM